MTKKILFTLSGIILFAAIVVAMYIANQKPSDEKFPKWMEETYAIDCRDVLCDVFEMENNGQRVVMQSVRTGYDPGVFVKKIYKVYRNLEDSSYYLEIKVEGFLNEYRSKNETIENVPKK